MGCGCDLVLPHYAGGGGGGGWPPDDYEEWHYVGQVTEPAFNTGYSNYTNPDTELTAFRREGDKVYLVGGVSIDVELVGSNPVFTLPVGYRPTNRVRLPVFLSGDPWTIWPGYIETDGDVFFNTGEIDSIQYLLQSMSWFWIDAPDTQPE